MLTFWLVAQYEKNSFVRLKFCNSCQFLQDREEIIAEMKQVVVKADEATRQAKCAMSRAKNAENIAKKALSLLQELSSREQHDVEGRITVD